MVQAGNPITQLTYGSAGPDLVPDSKDAALPLTLWNLSPYREVGWDTEAARPEGDQVRVSDWGHRRAGDREGVRHIKESLLGKVSWVYFPYGKGERALGEGAGVTEVKGSGRPEAALLRTALGTPNSSSSQEPQLAILVGTDGPEKLPARISSSG